MMGRRFYESIVPHVAQSLESIARELKRANDLKEADFEKRATEFLKWLAYDHDHKFMTTKDALDYWIKHKCMTEHDGLEQEKRDRDAT